MSVIQLLKKASNIFTSSNKQKKGKDVIKGRMPQDDNAPSSSQQEEKSGGGGDDNGGGGYGDNDIDKKEINAINVTKLFVGCLTQSTTSKELEDYFSQFGKVINSNVIRCPKSRKSRGFGFVTFIDRESAKAALEIKDHILNGNTINLQTLRSKSNERNYENRIFLGSLPFEFTEEDLKQFFSKFGEVDEAEIPLERNTMKSKGYGFLSFKDKLVAQKLIAEGFIYINKRRVLIKKAEPPDFYKINDNLSTHSSSVMNVDESLETSGSLADIELSLVSNDDTSSIVSGEEHSIIELNSDIQKYFEDYFLTKFSHFKTMNEKETKDESNKHKYIDDNIGEVEKILADFFINSNKQSRAFGEDLIEFSDNSEYSSSDEGEDTTDEEKGDDTDNNIDDDDDSLAKNFENSFQELSAQFTKILAAKSRSCTKISEFKSPAPQKSDPTTSQKSSMPFKIKDKKGSLVCSLCQWMPPESSCETFLAHCKTATHRTKLKERFLSEQHQEDMPETVFFQTCKQTQEISSKPEKFPKKLIIQESVSEKQNQNQKNQKCKKNKQKQLQSPQPQLQSQPQPQSQQQPQAKNVLIKKKSSKTKKNDKGDEKQTPQQNLQSKAKKIKTVKINALAKSMACIQPLSEHEIICRMCSKIIPEALDTNTLMKNVSYHLQSKGHLKKVLDIEDSLKKALEGNDKEKKGGNTKNKSSGEKNTPKVEISKQKDRNTAPLLKVEQISNQKKDSKLKNPAPETVRSNVQKEKTVKKKNCSNTADLKTEYICLSCNSYFKNKEIFFAHMNSKTHLNKPNTQNIESVSAWNNLSKCKGCKMWLMGSLCDINKHCANCLEHKN